jgi:hypothetical protein
MHLLRAFIIGKIEWQQRIEQGRKRQAIGTIRLQTRQDLLALPGRGVPEGIEGKELGHDRTPGVIRG